MTITAYQVSLDGATWIDVNTQYSLDTLPDRLPDGLAVTHCSLFNLFNCPIGARGRTFQPEYGSQWHYFLQEPLHETTAAHMRIAMIQAIARWEPRIQIDYANTLIQADYNLPGYQVKIVATNSFTQDPIVVRFSEKI